MFFDGYGNLDTELVYVMDLSVGDEVLIQDELHEITSKCVDRKNKLIEIETNKFYSNRNLSPFEKMERVR